MELFEFTQLLKELVDFYERKDPKPGTTELWFDKVRKIPSEPVKWIMKRIEDENESFPRNLPGALWVSYREWMQAYPDRVAHRQSQNCPDCTDGLIWARLIKNGRRYTYVFRCSRCRQDTTEAYPVAGRAELMADYDVIPKGGDPTDRRTVRVVNAPQDRTNQMEHIEPVVCRDRWERDHAGE